MLFAILYIAAVIVVMFLLQLFEKSKAFRGTSGEDLFPAWLHKLIRGGFLLMMFAPLLALHSYFWPPFLVYLFFFTDLSELNGAAGRSRSFVRTMGLWRFAAKYFPLKLVRDSPTPFPTDQKYIFALHPHGILPLGGVINLGSVAAGFEELFPGIELNGLAASFCFYVPIYRDLLLHSGVSDAARWQARKLLQQGKSLFLVPGGASEALHSSPDVDILELKRRRGFIRLAMQQGASLVPCFSFNENSTYRQLAPKNKAVNWLRTKFQRIFGFSLPLITHLRPNKVPITTVVGNPIATVQTAEPSEEAVTHMLETYIKELEQLYAKYGPRYNVPSNKKLVIV